MDVLFMGSGKFSLPLLDALRGSAHRVLAVVSQPDRPKGRGRRPGPTPVADYCRRENLHLYQPEDVNEFSFEREMRALSPGVVVTAAYGQKLSDEILALPRFAAINVHASLLPKYRGASPIARAILNGETQTGITICRMVEKLDAGPMYAQQATPIGPEETTPELEARLAPLGAPLLLEVLGAIEAGTAVEKPQNESKASFAPKFRKDEGRIRWKRRARDIHNMVRALQPGPKAYAIHGGRRVNLYRVRAEPGPASAPPGRVVGVDEAIRVACADGAVAILEVQPEGSRRMSAAEFLNGHPVKAGDSFQ